MVDSPYLVPFDGTFAQDDAPTAPPSDADPATFKGSLHDSVKRFAKLQKRLYAEDTRSLLLVFQAMDAAGKDSTILAVTSGVNPAGFQVSSFKRPSDNELSQDFLWRTTKKLPERGRIGVFNRSYYEEVLIVRIHPGILKGRPWVHVHDGLWAERFESIRGHEKHLALSGTRILKFWLKVSLEEQARRLLARIDDPDKNWKFAFADTAERAHWAGYHHAYEEALSATSRPWAPWYAIPADDKPFMRATVADVIARTLDAMDPKYPVLPEDERDEMAKAAGILKADLGAR